MEGSKGKCNYCGAIAGFQCSRCKAVYYCSAAHQKLDWSTHKPNCGAPASIPVSAGLIDDNLKPGEAPGTFRWKSVVFPELACILTPKKIYP